MNGIIPKSVLENYLSKIDEGLIVPFYNEFQAYFPSPTTQSIIRKKKEEELQYEFLQKLFDVCLGYTIETGTNQNLFIEQKNQTDSKKADGAIKIGLWD